ncbi:MAG: MoxR family ATPase [Candidatus Cloacimonetes bacterium]|nr:MoxR family ATPase [Candidatus Cloacimonadota bacterium]MCF7814500.1 MoxR family ATPase [Candidatus Cloacimonadota bacterium]MCF7869065.1 MoxR family ATPase [Candidatus Cloacimonadota bacterium]MCF7884460.1 MoxR family ATPase [Candidatus Cloacimonadota bacterium]
MSEKNIKILESLTETKQKIESEIGKVIVGQNKIIEQFLIALFSGGHCLLEGVPGLAKTLLISSMAKVMNMKFSRIQFTPDLMPSDITGTDILTEDKADGKRYFEYIKGPIFSNIILADEINRTPPKTQSALLQAMQEYQVTAGNSTYDLEKPFLVLATQNPIEQEGTYPLPEAQLDRFMFYMNIDYPSYEEEKAIVKLDSNKAQAEINSVISSEEIVTIQKAIIDVPVSDHVLDFAVKIVRASRPNQEDSLDFIKKWVSWGAGPRASQYLVYAARTRAALQGRLTPSIDDIKQIAEIVLQHRIIVTFAAEAEGITSKEIIQKLIRNFQ